MDSRANDELVADFVRRRAEHCFPLHVSSTTRRFVEDVLAILFPHYSETHRCDSTEIEAEVSRLESTLAGLMSSLGDVYDIPASASAGQFIKELPSIHETLIGDAKAIYYGDPAAFSVDEVILCYPGFYAICVHRVAHALWLLGFPLLPRLATEHAHKHTGIDIHPGAQIGHSFFIDHGTGVVIGETAEIGNGVKIYQGVTLGALTVDRDLKSRKRHPTIEDNVVIYANATILGGETVIGHDTVVAGNAWITDSVPPFSLVGRHSDVRPRRTSSTGDLEFYI